MLPRHLTQLRCLTSVHIEVRTTVVFDVQRRGPRRNVHESQRNHWLSLLVFVTRFLLQRKGKTLECQSRSELQNRTCSQLDLPEVNLTCPEVD